MKVKDKDSFRLRLTDFFLIALLLALAYIPWRQLPELVIRGDGFVYLISSTLNTFFSKDYFYTGFELSAAVLGSILPKFFKTDMNLYYATSLFVMMIINILFYILLRVITKNTLISFFGALMFAVNYFGNWDIYSQHCYCFFMERIVAVPFLLIAFIFLHLYLEREKIKFFLISLTLYFLGIGIAHFTVFFTAPFLLYPFFWNIFQKKFNKKSLIKGIAIGIVFFAVSVFFVLIQKISYSQIGPEHGFIEYFVNLQENRYPEKIIRQLVYWSQYEPVIRNIGISSLRDSLTPENASAITLYVVFIYLFAFLLIFKSLRHLRALLFTTVVGTAFIFYLNSWFGQYDVLFQPDANRYLYFPTILLVIFWTLFIFILIRSRKLWLQIVIFGVVGLYYILNSILISESFRDVLGWDRSTKVTYNHITTMRDRLEKNTLVVAPYPEVGAYESVFFTEQLGKEEVVFLGEENPYRDWRNIASRSAHVIKLKYSKKCDCVKERVIK